MVFGFKPKVFSLTGIFKQPNYKQNWQTVYIYQYILLVASVINWSVMFLYEFRFRKESQDACVNNYKQ